MCMNIRGASYYGASLHISVAMLFLGGFFIDLLGISEVWHNPYATYFSLILAFIYICLFLVFGLLIFRGVELESAKLLKGAIAGLLVLQLSALLVHLALSALTHSRKKAEEIRRLEHEFTLNRLPPPPPTTPINNAFSVSNESSSSAEVMSTMATMTMSDVGDGSIDEMNMNSGDDKLVIEDIPIVTLLQIISLVFGCILTIGYVVIVVMYVRSITPSRNRNN